MEDTLVIDGRAYITTQAAARILGYDDSYIARLCRQERIVGRHFNKRWVVDLDSLDQFITEHAERKALWQARLSQELKGVPRQTAVQYDPAAASSHTEHGARIRPGPQDTTIHAANPTQRSKPNVRVIATMAIASVAIFSIAIASIAPQRLASISTGGPNTFVAAVGDTATSSWFARTVCSWFSLCPAETSELTNAARDRVYQPVVVYEPKPVPAPAASSPSAAPAPRIVQNVTQPVIERIIERVTAPASLAGSFVTDALLISRLSDLERKIDHRISQIPQMSGGATPAYVGTFGLSQKIDRLDGVDIAGGSITDANISGGSVVATSLSGVLGIGTGGTGTSSAPSYGKLLLGNSGGTYDFVATSSLGISGVSTFTALSDVPSALSIGDTLYADAPNHLARLPASTNGLVLKLAGGVPTWSADLQGSGGAGAWATTTNDMAVYTADPNDIVLIGNNATSTTGNIFEVLGNSLFRGTVTAYQTITAPNFTATSSTASTFPYASSTALTVSGTGYFGTATTSNLVVSNSLTLPASSVTNAMLQNSSVSFGGVSVSLGSSDATPAFDLADATNLPIVGGTTGTLTVPRGGTGWTTLQANAVLLGNGAGAIATTSAGTNGQVLALVSGAPTWVATTTLGTISGTLGISQGGTGLTATPTFGQILRGTGSGFALVATSTLGVDLGDTTGTLAVTRGGTAISNPAAAQILLGSYAGGSWQQLATSSLGLITTDIAEGSSLYYLDSRVQSFVHASTTIPKSYTNNTFTGSNIFTGTTLNGQTTIANASTSAISGNTLAVGQTATTTVSSAGALFTPTLTVGTLTGPLQAIAGLVSASSSLSDFYVSDALTISAGTINSTPIGASSASTAIFTNATTGNATSTSLFATTASSTNLFTSSFTLATLSGFLKATAGAVSTALVNLATDITGILPVGNGGTGWAAIQSGTIPYGAGGGALATTSAGSAGQVLALLGGVPAWTATTTFSGGLTYSGGNVTNTGVTTLLGTANQITASGPTGAVTLSLPSLVSLTQASTTRLSVVDILYVGGSATTTIRGDNFASTLPYASSTAITVSGTGYFGTASTSNLTISLIRDTLLKAGSTGIVAAAVAGTDYATPSQISSAYPFPVAGNATTTLTQFNAGVAAYASSTIGNSTQAGGLTISGGATTTANLLVQGSATTTNLAITNLASTLLKTNATGGIIPAVLGTDYVNYAWPFTPTGYGVSTSTTVGFTNGLLSTASSTFTSALRLSSLSSGQLNVGAGGLLYSGASTTFSGGLTYTNGNVTMDWMFPNNATTSIINFTNGLLSASTTVNGNLVVVGNSTTTNATTTNLAISNIASANILKTTTGGAVVPAVSGTDYATPSQVSSAYPFPVAGNATSTLTQFNGGLTAFASSTVGSGTQAGGLTIWGGATTTGFLVVQGAATSTFAAGLQATALNVTSSSASSTFANGINLAAGCFAVNGTCVGGGSGGVGSGTQGQLPFYNAAGTSLTATSTLTLLQNTNLGVGTTTPLAKLTVYGDIFAEGSNRYLNFATAQGSSGYGFRDNAGMLEFKNQNGTWQGVTTATTGPSFSVHKNGTNQTVTSSTETVLTWSTELFDTNNNFNLSTERFTPTVPGKYLITASSQCNDNTSYCIVGIYKNGTTVSQNTSYPTGVFASPLVTTLIEMNGSTDYVEAFARNDGGTTIAGNTNTTYFTGALIAPVNATAGGWQNDGTQSFLADSTDKVGIGTTTPWGQLSVNPNGISGPSFVVGSSTATNFIVTNSGRVGIGTTSPGYALGVVGDINFTGALREDGNEIFASMIAPFAGSCPTGWSEYTAARGRAVVGTPSGGTNAGTVGSALTDLGTRTVTDVPSHLHAVDPPATASDSQGAHTHTTGGSGGSGAGTGFNAGTSPATQQTGSSGAHTHTVDIASFNSGSTGVASVDVTMPYIQLTYCQKAAGADIAEWIPASEDIEKATIISTDPDNRERVIASRTAYDNSVVGIVATQPGWLLGQETKDSVQMALAGRVPLRVSLKNGEIKIGDPITTSSIPGVGMKATKAGPTVGKAMEAVNETSALTNCTDPMTGREEQCATALVFVNISWYSPTLDESEDIAVQFANAYTEPLSIGADFETGDIVALEYRYPQKQGDSAQTEKTGYLMPASAQGYAVGVISTEIGRPGNLLRRKRENNRIVEELRIIESGKAEMNISPSSSAIQVGDPIAVASNDAGRGTKAETTGFILARALEAWDPNEGMGAISVMVDSAWWVPPLPEQPHDHEHGGEDFLGHFFDDAHTDGHGKLGFLQHLFAHIIDWLADAQNGITDFFAQRGTFSERVTAPNVSATNELCVDDICVTRDQFAAVFGAYANDNQPSSTSQDSASQGPPLATTFPAHIEIVITGNNPATLNIGDAYADLGATASSSDQSLINLGVRTFYGGEEVTTVSIDTTQAGEHTIAYRVLNASGDILAEAMRTVIVAPSELANYNYPPAAAEPIADEPANDNAPLTTPDDADVHSTNDTLPQIEAASTSQAANL